MRCPVSIRTIPTCRKRIQICSALVIGLIFGQALPPAHAQFQLQRAIKDVMERSVTLATSLVLQDDKAAPHKAVYQYGLAPVMVGVSPNGSTIGYKLMLLAVVPANLP